MREIAFSAGLEYSTGVMKNDSRLPHGNRLREVLVRWADDSPAIQRVAYWIGKTAGGAQLRLLKLRSPENIPWTPLKKPLSELTVALVTTGGVYCCADQPFDMVSDATFRAIPRAANSDELCIAHDHYDRKDAARDINLIFPLERLRELEQEGTIGRVADVHYGFGFTKDPSKLLEPGREIGKLLKQAGVDLALLVPA